MKKLFLMIMALSLLLVSGTGLAEEPMTYQEVKLTSSYFGGTVVGKAVVPVGWNVTVQDLTLGSESITWPNAVYVTAASPDGSATFHYISRRDFRDSSVLSSAYSTRSQDDSYDQSTMMHTLHYRTADQACDLMVNVLFGNAGHTFLYEAEKTAEETAFLEKFRQLYLENRREGLAGQIREIGIQNMELKGVDLTAAERIYRSGSKRTSVAILANGFETYTTITDGYYMDVIDWSMNCLYAMQADDALFDQYYPAFTVFRMNTGISQEYSAMTNLHSTYLQNYLMELKNGNPNPPDPTNDMDKATADTVKTGDTYSAMEGWSDTIQDRNDYETGDGSHVKVPTLYDHVYEGDDGRIYAQIGNSMDPPYGSKELYPTAVGQ